MSKKQRKLSAWHAITMQKVRQWVVKFWTGVVCLNAIALLIKLQKDKTSLAIHSIKGANPVYVIPSPVTIDPFSQYIFL